MIEVISDAKLECGEGPMWDTETGTLYWTDALGETVFQYDRASGEISNAIEGRQAGAVLLRADGGFVLGTHDGFFRWTEAKGLELLANECDGHSLGAINDIIADPRGRVFGGPEMFDEEKEYERGYLYRLDPDGSIRAVDDGVALSNGLGFSPDLSTFYFTDSIERVIYAYDYDVDSGAIRNRRNFVTLTKDDGLPDGMTVDADGFVWSARWFGAGVSRYDPDGTLERKIDFPVAQTSSVMFGGAELNELYVTSAAVMWESPEWAPTGHDFSLPRGGPTYRITQDIVGRPEYRAGI